MVWLRTFGLPDAMTPRSLLGRGRETAFPFGIQRYSHAHYISRASSR